ncbi:N-terminal nucleophile aminohydrolase [Microthyrium microscopicum]|uniref:N-terminal nucleophile aminohydrolase n=1 Tax=Microthyrium microscopicum TaxID=703497 RepID=A0A6A6U6W0_9PEZI|nr:N-terminal nucleophile aminohydrolase [Microthyrium microscopicum]
MTDQKSNWAIVVHCGAGYHSRQNQARHLRCLDNACRSAAELLRRGAEATEAIVAAVKEMEDDPITNAGFGSNLTESGTLEGDATLVGKSGAFGAVGAIPKVRNPIAAAQAVYAHAREPMALNRMPPNLVAGESAANYYATLGGRLDIPENIVEDAAVAQHAVWRQQLDDHERGDSDIVNDTVGAIAIDSYGEIAAASSSGGLGLKKPGRIGPAALNGVGTSVFPRRIGDPLRRVTAIVASGSGEDITKVSAAAFAAERLYDSKFRGPNGDLQTCVIDEGGPILENFIQEEFLRHPAVLDTALTTPPVLGLVGLKSSVDGAFMYYAHNSQSFALGSMTSTDKKPVVMMSRIGSSSKSDIVHGARRLLSSSVPDQSSSSPMSQNDGSGSGQYELE